MTGAPSFQPHPYTRVDTWANAYQISQQLNVNIKYVTYRLKSWGYSPQFRPHREEKFRRMVAYYPPEAVHRITQNVRERKAIPEMGSHITLVNTCEQLGTTREWVISTISKYNLPKPALRRLHDMRVAQSISRSSFRRLQQLKGEFAPEEWKTANELSSQSGWSAGTVQRRLIDSGLGKTFTSLTNGHTSVYYPPEALLYLGDKHPSAKPAGEWLSTSRMSRELERSFYWVSRQIKVLGFDVLGEYRADDTTNPAMHYPPEVFAKLRKVSKSASRIAPPGWQSATAMAKMLDVRPSVARKFLSQPHFSHKKRLMATLPKMQTHYYYPPEVVRDFERWIQAKANQFLAA